jgi:radical SAM superfamily enzyme YgiQ (UPF0313 family)
MSRFARILLTHSNHVFADSKQTAKMQPYPPLQTILAAAVLRDHGCDVKLFDPTLESPDAFDGSFDEFLPDLVVVCEDDFNFLSKMCLAPNRELACRMAAICRRRGVPSVAHGSDATDHAEEYLRAGFDFVIAGEVEFALRDLASGTALEEIGGLMYRRGPEVARNARQTVRGDAESLPLPAWDLVDVERYRDAWMQAHGYFSLNMAASRGCPYRCNWCAKPIHGNNYQARNAAQVAAEIGLLKRLYRPDRIWFADDIFALQPRWAEEFATAVEAERARIPFKMQSRCDLMTRRSVSALKRAGCEEVWMGAESGSQRILDAMDKGTRVEEIAEAVSTLRREGIRSGLFLQFGYPGEEWADIELTIEMVRRLRPDDVGISVSYPLPGTKFHQVVSAQIGAQANWKNSGDLSMMFRGTYSTEFYRALADAIHVEVREGRPAEREWNRVEALREQPALVGMP